MLLYLLYIRIIIYFSYKYPYFFYKIHETNKTHNLTIDHIIFHLHPSTIYPKNLQTQTVDDNPRDP